MKKKKINHYHYYKRKRIDNTPTIHKRYKILIFVVIICFIILTVKLYKVQVLDSKRYMDAVIELSNNIVEGSTAPRGRIYDRNGILLVDNIPVKTIAYKKVAGITTTQEIEMAYKVASMISVDYKAMSRKELKRFWILNHAKEANAKITTEEWQLLEERKLTVNDISSKKLERVTDKDLEDYEELDYEAAYIYYLMNKGYTYEEKIIKSNVSDSEYAFVSENNNLLNGFNTKIDWERVYPYGDTFKSILGTVSTSTQGIPADLKDYYLEKGYSLNDRVGLSYLEKQYEEYLHGEKAIYKVINSHETKLLKEGSRGKDIVLSIDINLQQEVEKILAEQIRNAKGEANTDFYDHSSVIIQEPATGEILAMAGARIVNGEIVDNTTSLLMQPITPGSVVKGASMLVAYNEGAVKIGEKMLDECVKVAGVSEKCSSVNNLGVINDITALAKSSNVYQFKAAIRVNGQEYHRGMKLNFNQKAFDTYRNMYHSFGLGVKTEIDLPVESNGYGAKKDKASGNLLDFVMGQYEAYTPMQLSQYVNTIANGGERLVPHLLKEVHSSSSTDSIGKLELKIDKKVLNTIDTSEEYMNRVKEGFVAVLNSPGGYGVGYMDKNMKPAGKTGTSQSFIDTDNDGVIDTETITSSFIGYAPYDNPKMSIIVTSPDSSHPNSSSDFASLVTYRITREVTNKYAEIYK